MKKRTASITIETERLLVISRARESLESWCTQCNEQSNFIAVDEAAAVAGISERTIFRWAEAGAIHLLETAQGKAMFCLKSIVKLRTSTMRRLLRS